MNGVNNYAELAYDEEEDTYDDDYEDYDQVRPILYNAKTIPFKPLNLYVRFLSASLYCGLFRYSLAPIRRHVPIDSHASRR